MTNTTTTKTRARTPAIAHPLTPRDIWRQEVARSDAEKHERAYFMHVVAPLAEQGYPRPRPQALLIPNRRFRFDYAYIAARLAVEIQGQIWRKGGHTSGHGITRDAEKLNELACIGWRCLHITPEQIDSGEAKDWTERALRAAGLRTARSASA